MERLTKRLPSGAADYNYPVSCYFDDDSGPDRIAQSAFRQRCVERLADYEDTRLMPEEVERSKLEIEAGCVKAIARMYGIDINRLRELAEADREGRLIIVDNTPRQISPCDTCESGWGTATTIGYDLCFNHCEKLAEYRKREAMKDGN